MFDDYEVDFGKVNWFLCRSMNVLEEEMEELLKFPPPHVQYYPTKDEAYEVVGYTKQRKFLSVTFTLEDDRLVVQDVNLPSYETIQDVILRQFAAGSSPFHDR